MVAELQSGQKRWTGSGEIGNNEISEHEPAPPWNVAILAMFVGMYFLEIVSVAAFRVAFHS